MSRGWFVLGGDDLAGGGSFSKGEDGSYALSKGYGGVGGGYAAGWMKCWTQMWCLRDCPDNKCRPGK